MTNSVKLTPKWWLLTFGPKPPIKGAKSGKNIKSSCFFVCVQKLFNYSVFVPFWEAEGNTLCVIRHKAQHYILIINSVSKQKEITQNNRL